MHTSPSRQSSDEDADVEEESDDSDDPDGEGVADDVSVPEVVALSVDAGPGEAVVSVAVSVASDTVEADCDSAEAVTAVRGTGVPLRGITCVAGVARGVAADCSRGAFGVEDRVAGEVRFARCVSAGVDETGVESVTCSSAPPMACLSGAEAACVRSGVWRFSEETVKPPPTRATAVATSALRCVFFQRSR
ncbi:hypothetical protein [Streptomyces sp. SID12488]|uniref:hypothetical protein n=1 Tax=Streptomyces sp. SID12488 TaxID=2706040 RepID=UPI0013DB07FF|nr:hypothetical protein [Streptomyces sp. SID12488]NEA66225.1 hypothetical protein [Streptomyces sp. SID12488]